MEAQGNNNPLTDFSNCHIGIINNFQELRTLPTMANDPKQKKQAKKLASKVYTFFNEVVLRHHAEEEDELFVAVLDSLTDDENSKLAKEYIDKLTTEHRQLEKFWNAVKSDVKKLSKGKNVKLDEGIIEALSKGYLAHARFEEEYFLPLSEILLNDNELSALGLSLHMDRNNFHIQNYL